MGSIMFTPSFLCGLRCVMVLILIQNPALADGLDDLQTGLDSLKQSAAFSGILSADVKNIREEDDQQVIKQGTMQVKVAQTMEGLSLLYSTKTLAAIEEESNVKRKNSAAATPTIEAMNRFNFQEMALVLNPLLDLQTDLNKAKFIKEEESVYQGKPARLLSFRIPFESLSQEERKNLKKFKTDFKIWIDEKGMPLASHSTGKGSGRFALVIGFEFHFDVQKTYSLHNNRLLVTHLKSSSGNSGGGMKGEEIITASLKLD
jgi:hypothetical protein